MSKVYLTNHVYDHMKERAGISRKAADRFTAKAYEDGSGREEISGRLQQYMTTEARTYGRDGSDVKVYGEMVYCFMHQPNGVLFLTVFWVPNNLKNLPIAFMIMLLIGVCGFVTLLDQKTVLYGAVIWNTIGISILGYAVSVLLNIMFAPYENT